MSRAEVSEIRGGSPPRFTLSEKPFDSLRSLRVLRLLTRGQAPALSESKGKEAKGPTFGDKKSANFKVRP